MAKESSRCQVLGNNHHYNECLLLANSTYQPKISYASSGQSHLHVQLVYRDIFIDTKSKKPKKTPKKYGNHPIKPTFSKLDKSMGLRTNKINLRGRKRFFLPSCCSDSHRIM